MKYTDAVFKSPERVAQRNTGELTYRFYLNGPSQLLRGNDEVIRETITLREQEALLKLNDWEPFSPLGQESEPIEPPPPFPNPDFSNVIRAAQEYMDYLGSDDPNEDRLSKYKYPIFEAVMEAIFGDGVWDYINASMGCQ